MPRPPRKSALPGPFDKLRAGPFLLLLIAGAVLWITISRPPARTNRAPSTNSEPAARADADHRPRTQPAGSAGTAPSTSSSQASANRTEANPEHPPRERTPQGALKPTIPTLAVAAQPPSGPTLGPGLTPTAVLQNMRSVFRQYSSRFGANPVGTNPEITSALNGGNSKQVVFVDQEDGLRINERGELIDNWGTPFFFHQLSAKEMEIHSAGPDRKMWTADDLVMK